MKKILFILIQIVAIFLVLTVHAQTTIKIYPVVEGYARDSDGDGFFDNIGNLAGTDLYIVYDPTNLTNQYRAALEFSLSTLALSPGTVIENAELNLSWGGLTNPDTAFVDILSYQGDGVSSFGDYTPATVMESWTFTGTEVVSGALEALNVTDFIQSLLDGSQDYAGFSFAGNASTAYMLASFTSTRSDRDDRWPILTITYSDAPPSEPNIEETIDFFHQAVEEGTLEGSVGGIRGRARLFMMNVNLIFAKYFIERNLTNYACWYLRISYRGCDGEGADLVKGEDTDELAQMIYDLAVSLDCGWTTD